MRRISLRSLNFVVWATVLLLVVVFHSELRWGLSSLPAAWRGTGFPGQPQWQMYSRANAIWETTGRASEAIALLDASLTIEPNPAPMHLLGRIHASEGRLVEAETVLLRLRAFDPSHLDGILDLADLYGELGRANDRHKTLADALAWFESQEPRYRPVTDPSVRQGYNDKADQVHSDYVTGLNILAARLRLLEGGHELLPTE